MLPSEKLLLDGGEKLSPEDTTHYRSVVGALQYLSLTRPDISFCVNRVYQFMSSRTSVHCVNRVLACVLQSPALIFLVPSDWVGNPDDRQSTGGYAIFVGGNLISWNSRKQSKVSCSSTEAEYKAVDDAIAELI